MRNEYLTKDNEVIEEPITGKKHEIEVNTLVNIIPGKSHLSNGDIGYPEEYFTRLDSFKYLGPDDNCPMWLTEEFIKENLDL
jgi:hypothetical protein